MQSFAQYIVEIFDTKFPLKYHTHTDADEDTGDPIEHHEYTFKATPKHHVKIHFAHDQDKTANVDFTVNNKVHMTGEHKHHAHRIMSGVKQAIDQHLQNHPHIENLQFSSLGSSRTKVYKKLLGRKVSLDSNKGLWGNTEFINAKVR